jgi:hypothetical protein
VVLLEPAQLSGFFLAATDEARFLQLEIADLLFVGKESMGVDQVRAGGEFVLFKQIREFDVAPGEEGGLQSRDAGEAPVGIGNRLNKLALVETHGFVLFREGGEMLLVSFGVIAGEQNGAAVSAVLTALREVFALPASVRGPVESFEFAWLAARRAGEMQVSNSGAAAASVANAFWRVVLRASFSCLRSRARRMDRAVMERAPEMKMARVRRIKLRREPARASHVCEPKRILHLWKTPASRESGGGNEYF